MVEQSWVTTRPLNYLAGAFEWHRPDIALSPPPTIIATLLYGKRRGMTGICCCICKSKSFDICLTLFFSTYHCYHHYHILLRTCVVWNVRIVNCWSQINTFWILSNRWTYQTVIRWTSDIMHFARSPPTTFIQPQYPRSRLKTISTSTT